MVGGVNCELQVVGTVLPTNLFRLLNRTHGKIGCFKMVFETRTLQTVHGHVLSLALSLGPCFGCLTSVCATPVVEINKLIKFVDEKLLVLLLGVTTMLLAHTQIDVG